MTTAAVQSSRWLFALALVTLAAGCAVYLAERDPARVWLMPAGWSLASMRGLLPAVLSGSSPSLVHVFVFSVLTALCLRRSRVAIAASCLGWFAIDALFEIGQHRAIAPALIGALPAWFARVPLLDHVAPFLRNGTFDTNDLAAVAIGAVAAWLSLDRTRAHLRSQS